MGRGDYVTSATAKVEIWRGPLRSLRRYMELSLARRDGSNQRRGHRGAGLESEGRGDFTATAKSLKLLGFGGELVQRIFTSRTDK